MKEIHVKVTPNAKKERVQETKSGFAIDLREKAEEGVANVRLTELLAKRFSVPRKNIIIVRGAAARSKIVRVYGTDKN